MSVNTLTPLKINALPISGSGSKTQVGQDLITHNKNLTMQLAQVSSDTKYDATTPAPPTKQVFVESFTSAYEAPVIRSLAVSGILIFIYGLVVE
jgi:hypothetical protein